MLSLSFLPWALLMLAVVMAVPIAAMVDSSKRSKPDGPKKKKDKKKKKKGKKGAEEPEEAEDGEIAEVEEPLDAEMPAEPAADDAMFDDDPFKDT